MKWIRWVCVSALSLGIGAFAFWLIEYASNPESTRVDVGVALLSGLVVGLLIFFAEELRESERSSAQAGHNAALVGELKELGKEQRRLADEQGKQQRELNEEQAAETRSKDIEVSMLTLLATELRPRLSAFVDLLHARRQSARRDQAQDRKRGLELYSTLLEAQYGLQGLAHLADDDEMKRVSQEIGVGMYKIAIQSRDFSFISNVDSDIVEQLRSLNDIVATKLGVVPPTRSD